jgi:hypothetical protein
MELDDLPAPQHKILVALSKRNGPAVRTEIEQAANIDLHVDFPLRSDAKIDPLNNDILVALMRDKYLLATLTAGGSLWTLAKKGRAYLAERGLL